VSFSNPKILYPERSMQQAKTAAMNSILRLIRENASELPELYDRSQALFDAAINNRECLSRERDPERFVPICDVEKYLRKNFLELVFNTTALYGNKETKRIYSWKEGTIGSLNVLLNIAGAQLRLLGMTRYPFPLPQEKKVRRINKSGKEYFQKDYVYGGTRRRPTVIITHPMLPSLDFVDAIRGHLVELCRQCFIHSVPIGDASRYINLLIFKLRPILDKLYLAGFEKKRRTVKFTERSISILHSVVEMIHGQHGFTIGYPSRMTAALGDIEYSTLETSELFDKIDDPKIRQVLTQKIELEKLIGNEDVTRFANKVTNTVSRIGTRIHQRMAWGITQPFSSMSVMLSGDYLARDKTGYLLAAEVPVNAGRGKIDYSLFVRKIPTYIEEDPNSMSGLWVPGLVLDLKTKSAFNWGAIAKPHDPTNSNIIDFPLKRRPLTDIEWEIAIKNTPDATQQKQVTTYTDALLQEYRAVAKDDLNPPDSCLRGIILVDGHDFPSRLRRILSKFIKAVYEQVRKDMLEMRTKDQDGKVEYPRTLFVPTFRWSLEVKIAIVIFPFIVPENVSIPDVLPHPAPQQSLLQLDPFENRKEDSMHFILYLTGDDVNSPGDSAGWIAKHWHGLQFAYESAQKHNSNKVVWIDIAGQFTDDNIRAATMRLSFHHNRVREFYKSITFLDFSNEIVGALFSGDEILSVEAIHARIKEYDFIIVSGIDSIRKIIPIELDGLIDTLTVHITEATHRQGACTLWFGSPSPLATSSKLYKRQQLQPFRYDSPLQPYIDEIVLNMPFPPRKGGSNVPKYDHVRGLLTIIPVKTNGFDCATIGVPPLIGWSKRFLSRGPSDEEQELMNKLRIRPPSTFRWLDTLKIPAFSRDMAVELFPFIGSWCHISKARQSDRNLESLKVKKKILGRKKGTKEYRGVLSRLTFTKELCKPSPSSVNTKRQYRTTKLELEPLKSTSLPPHTSELVYNGFPSSDAGKMELARLQDVSLFLLKRDNSSTPLKEQCLEFVKALTRPERLTYIEALQDITDIFRKSRYFSQIWYRLLWSRDWLEGWPMPAEMKKAISKVQVGRRDILQHYGNYLVFMIASLAEHYSLHQTEIEALWNMVRPWVIMQMGASPRTLTRPLSKYDTRAVYEQLRAKAKYWNSASFPRTTILSNIRYGLRIDLKKGNPKSYRWYIFEDGAYSSRFIAGCVEQESKKSDQTSLIRANTMTPLDEINALTDFKFRDCRIRPFLIADHQGISILYEADRQLNNQKELDNLTTQDSFNWQPVGMMRYGTRSRGAPARLRYIKVLTLGMRYPSIHNQKLPTRQANLGDKLFGQIKTIGSLTSGLTRVKCSLSGTYDSGSISFKVHDKKKWNKTGQSIDYKDIDQAAQALLLPYNVGIAVQGKYSWDPLTDVQFGLEGKELKKIVVSRIRLDKDEGV